MLDPVNGHDFTSSSSGEQTAPLARVVLIAVRDLTSSLYSTERSALYRAGCGVTLHHSASVYRPPSARQAHESAFACPEGIGSTESFIDRPQAQAKQQIDC